VSVTSSPRLASLPLPPRALPVRRRKPVGRSASGRILCIDKDTVDKVSVENGALPRVSDMPLDFPVLVVGAGVSSFKVQHVGAALRARGARGYWLVELQPRPRASTSGRLAEMMVGFPGLHIERICSTNDL
jgi:hypothetical protein